MTLLKQKKVFLFIFLLLSLTSCKQLWNNPYNDTGDKNIYYGSFSESPKTLDPARSYTAEEAIFVAQIYEPPLQYNYLKRPYQLEPLTAEAMPTITFVDQNGTIITEAQKNPKAIAFTIYDITIKPHIYYQPHSAFSLKKEQKRELTADDYVYEIKRLADPRVQSPIYGFLSDYIVGLKEFHDSHPTNLIANTISGVEVIDRYHYRIKIKGIYPQFIYWLATPFFAPMPWEADTFYNQPKMKQKNISIETWPIGTGAYLLEENNPNQRIVLARNPNFHDEFYPREGEPSDVTSGLLKDAGKKLPFIDRYIFTLEKETIPRWNKFLQGYYDASGISPDSFSQVIWIDEHGQPHLTKEMQDKNIRLKTSVSASIFYYGFNFLDDVVGGNSERARKLRQAISIAIDTEEFISIFLNGRGTAAFSPIPPGIDGFSRFNPYVYNEVQNHAERKSINIAKQLLKEAGYNDGIDPKTKKQLVIHYDVPASQDPDDRARLEWIRKQFQKLNIELDIRATLYNRFQEKMRTGNTQFYVWGWSADYPDPENFLFLLYGPNGKVKFGGENASNYSNPIFDSLFVTLQKGMPTPEQKQLLLKEMMTILQYDAPWVFGYYPKNFVLQHAWVNPTKPNDMAHNTLKYISIDPTLRVQKRKEWNHPVLWPFIMIFIIVLLLILPAIIRYWHYEHDRRRKEIHHEHH